MRCNTSVLTNHPILVNTLDVPPKKKTAIYAQTILSQFFRSLSLDVHFKNIDLILRWWDTP